MAVHFSFTKEQAILFCMRCMAADDNAIYMVKPSGNWGDEWGWHVVKYQVGTPARIMRHDDVTDELTESFVQYYTPAEKRKYKYT